MSWGGGSGLAHTTDTTTPPTHSELIHVKERERRQSDFDQLAELLKTEHQEALHAHRSEHQQALDSHAEQVRLQHSPCRASPPRAPPPTPL